MISCMGGWCNQRDKCWHYHVESHIIVERLCGKLEEPEIISSKVILLKEINVPCNVQH